MNVYSDTINPLFEYTPKRRATRYMLESTQTMHHFKVGLELPFSAVVPQLGYAHFLPSLSPVHVYAHC